MPPNSLWVDARAAGDDAPDGVVLATGVALAVLYPLAGLLALGLAVMAAALFLLAAALGLVVGRTGGWDGLAIYGLLALLLAAASVVCARRQRTRLNVEERPV